MSEPSTRAELQAWLDAQVGTLVCIKSNIPVPGLRIGDIGLVVSVDCVPEHGTMDKDAYGATYLFNGHVFPSWISPRSQSNYVFEILADREEMNR